METYGPGIAPAYERSPVEEPMASSAPETLPQDWRKGWAWLLWDSRRFLLSTTWKTVVLATLVAFLIPVRYRSTTELIPGNNTNTSLLSAIASRATGGLGMDAAGLLGFNTPSTLYLQILQSRTVRDRLVDRFDLREVYGKKYYNDAREQLAKVTSIDEDRKSNVITLSVTDRSPERAAQMARAYVAEMNRLAADLNTSAAHRERVFIEERLKTVKQDLDSAERALSEFSSRTSAIDIKEQGRALVEAAATLQGQLIAAQSELKGLEQVYSQGNVRVRSVRARIAELQRQLEKLGGQYTQPGPAANAEAALELYPSIRKLPALGYQYAELYRKAKIQETVYELLTQQYELAKIQEAKELPTVRVMDEAEVPERKAYPPRGLIITTSAVFAVLLAGFWVVVRDRWQGMDPRDQRKRLALEIYNTAFTRTRRAWARLGRAPRENG